MLYLTTDSLLCIRANWCVKRGGKFMVVTRLTFFAVCLGVEYPYLEEQ